VKIVSDELNQDLRARILGEECAAEAIESWKANAHGFPAKFDAKRVCVLALRLAAKETTNGLLQPAYVDLADYLDALSNSANDKKVDPQLPKIPQIRGSPKYHAVQIVDREAITSISEAIAHHARAIGNCAIPDSIVRQIHSSVKSILALADSLGDPDRTEKRVDLRSLPVIQIGE
jgi:exoribonuclease R